MRIHIIAVGTRMPGWVSAGYQEFATRLPRECNLRLIEIPAPRRGKHTSTGRILRTESERMLAAIPRGTKVIALDMRGQQWSTRQLATELADWLQGGRDIGLLVGGPEGLGDACHQRADCTWSLSRLTLPHPLVRIVVAEQLYRAWSLLHHHPYHRA